MHLMDAKMDLEINLTRYIRSIFRKGNLRKIVNCLFKEIMNSKQIPKASVVKYEILHLLILNF